jgi:hypothetical protein
MIEVGAHPETIKQRGPLVDQGPSDVYGSVPPAVSDVVTAALEERSADFSRTSKAVKERSDGSPRRMTCAFGRGGERTRTADFYVAKEETGHDVPPHAAKCQVAAARTRCHLMPRGTRAMDAPSNPLVGEPALDSCDQALGGYPT